uniref:PEP-CTERM sorting domain-containing protein n=1 Tax=Desulfatirhabdium butyrativorans TaxID=340467 RepID=A0A7C4MSK6_9BACT
MKKIALVCAMSVLWVAVTLLPVWAVAGPEQGKGGGADQGAVECPQPTTTKPPVSGKVPEPMTMALLAAGGAGAVALRKWSKK